MASPFAQLLSEYGCNIEEAQRQFQDTEAPAIVEAVADARRAGERLCASPRDAGLASAFEASLAFLELRVKAAVARMERMVVHMEQLMDNAAIGQVHAHAQTAPFRAQQPAEPGVVPVLMVENPALGANVEPSVLRVVASFDVPTIGRFM